MNPNSRFGVNRTTSLKLGTAHVSIPRDHGRGLMESPAVFETPSPDRHVSIESIDRSPRFDFQFWDEMRAAVQQSPQKRVFVFIHGYFTDFPTAICRTAQIAHDVNLDGVAVAYSWASQAYFWGYAADAANVEWTEPYLTRFLETLERESGAEHILILAHSLGTRALVRAVREVARGRGGRRGAEFDQIVLAASDIDAEIFARDYAPHLTRAAVRTTVYVSNNDWALLGAQRLYGYARLGQFWSLNAVEDLVEASLDRINVVDVTAHDHGFYGHIYYGSSPRVLDDLIGIFAGESPEERGLKKVNDHYSLQVDAKPRIPASRPANPSEGGSQP